MKHCSKCNKDKELSEFYKDKSRKDGLSHFCKICHNEMVENRKQKNIEKFLEYQENYRKEHKEENREYQKEYGKKYRQENKEKIRIRSKEYNQSERGKEVAKKASQKQKESGKQKEYAQSEQGKLSRYKNNQKRKENGKTNEYLRNKRKNDFNYRFASNLRTRINQILKNQKNYKNNHALDLLGCSLEHLKQHIESQFQEGMTFENQGEWHIDHIIPCAYFDLSIEENQKICFNFRNLQPLWKSENCSKKAKVPLNVENFI